MTLGAHLLMSWLLGANALQARRERTVVALAGLAPDLDGLGIVIDKITGTTDYFFHYHHYLGHSVLSAFVIATLASIIARGQREWVWLLSFVAVHLHVLCDVLGSRGPDGYQWPVYYLYPFNAEFGLTWSHQWPLHAWPNQLIIALLLLGNVYFAAKKRITFIEVISASLNREAFKLYDKYAGKAA